MSLVSVIIPNYNYAHFLKQRIDSVLNQTYKELEVIILDDCSKDLSKNVIESYRGKERVTHIVYNEHNSGTTFKQWRKGFDLAKGEFIWIAEADDYADPRLLEVLIDRMADDKEIKVGFVNSNWVTPESMFINRDFTISKPLQVYDGKCFVHDHLLKENYIYNASMAVFRRDALAQIDDQYMSFRSCGDKLFWKNLAVQGKVLYVCEALNYFRIHDAKVTTNSMASGLLFEEENRFFHINIKDGTISDYATRIDVIKYFLKYIKRVRHGFKNNEVYLSCKEIWSNEWNPMNRQLPLAFRARCLLYRLLKI